MKIQFTDVNYIDNVHYLEGTAIANLVVDSTKTIKTKVHFKREACGTVIVTTLEAHLHWDGAVLPL